MNNDQTISLDRSQSVPFQNNASHCVGTGHMSLALRREYLEQLKMVQAKAKFSFIRGHGLFCDDMAICQCRKDEDGTEHFSWNFTYLDQVVDAYLDLGIRPFLELGFMPEALASGKQTIFWWKGNITPPKNEEEWCNLVRATLTHLAQRYGRDEVSTWPCEVWNEPNLRSFWENADEEKYHHLYRITAKAVKEALPDMKVGGPAVCGGATTPDWIRRFLEMCNNEDLPCDFLTRHMYMANTPEVHGRYEYHTMREVDDVLDEMRNTREIIDSFERFRGMPMHITEFNTSYNPFCPIHDTNYNAACIAALLARLGDVADSYSYWTFGDVFEECGVPSRPFHGGFGMVASGNIPKPTFWTFVFFNNLKGKCIYRDEQSLIMARENGDIEGVLWNLQGIEEKETISKSFSIEATGEWQLITRVVDETNCNPLRTWHEMGEPASLTAEQLDDLRAAGQPAFLSQCIAAPEQKLNFGFELTKNSVVHFKLQKKTEVHDFGYDYSWYCKE